jgi:MarR family transcriptional regulator, organic hydroperoxide resistance regulator
MNDTGSDEERERAIDDFTRAGRQSSRLSVMFRHAIASKLGLTVTDMECLDFLTDTGSATAGQLADQTNLTTGAITSMIRRLEQAGYVTSRRDPADRRRVIVTLMPEKLDQGRRLYASFAEDGQRMINDYSTRQLQFLARHYDRMTEIYLAQLQKIRTDTTEQHHADAPQMIASEPRPSL